MEETYTIEMAKIFKWCKEVGEYQADVNWYECKDPDFIIDENKERKTRMDFKITEINDRIKGLGRFLSEEELSQLTNECKNMIQQHRDQKEETIEREHRPTTAYMNNKAIINLTDLKIPDDILLALSFGHKFLFPYACKENNLCELLAQLDLTLSDAIPDLKRIGAEIEICNILKKESRIQGNSEKRWLSFIYQRTQRFLTEHDNIFATKSDKGGHTVIIDQAQYMDKLMDLLKDESYSIRETCPLERLVKKESLLLKKLHENENTNKILKNLKPYEPNTLGIAKFYGLVKIHKKNNPLRPITAMNGCVGFLLSKVLDKMLQQAFPIADLHIKDTYQFVHFIGDTELNTKDILVSFDVVSMFTSIPINLAKELILNKAHRFVRIFDVDSVLLGTILNFLLCECTYFTAMDQTYQQTKGLPMGSCISPTIARIVMDNVVAKLMKEVPSITFIKVYVDDTIVAMNKDLIDEALKSLNGFCEGRIKFTRELEDDNNSLNFLNLTLKRIKEDKRNYIITNWYKKSFASGRLVNFLSSHKRTTIIQTAIHFVKTVLLLSDPVYYHDNRNMVEKTLEENSFPITLISTIMNSYYTYMKNGRNDLPFEFYPNFIEKWLGLFEKQKELKEKELNNQKVSKQERIYRKKYAIFPHSIMGSRSIKRIIYENKYDTSKIAESVRNTKLNSITTRKTFTPLGQKGNVILYAICQCRIKTRILMTRFNETANMAKRNIFTKYRKCKKGNHAYTKITLKKGLFYSNQTKILLTYIQYKNRKQLDTKYGYEFPTSKLKKLIKN